MGHGSCDTHGGEEKVLVGNLKERFCLEALAVDGKKIFVCILRDRGFNGADWINLVEAGKCGGILRTRQ